MFLDGKKKKEIICSGKSKTVKTLGACLLYWTNFIASCLIFFRGTIYINFLNDYMKRIYNGKMRPSSYKAKSCELSHVNVKLYLDC